MEKFSFLTPLGEGINQRRKGGSIVFGGGGRLKSRGKRALGEGKVCP